jgi:Arc/MetJ-type ribon-helix-helix transcriptional regulator
MSNTVTFRLDTESERILDELTRRKKRSRSGVVREALRTHWQALGEHSKPTAWEVYSKLKISKERPYRDTARNVSKLLKEKLLAKRRDGTL